MPSHPITSELRCPHPTAQHQPLHFVQRLRLYTTNITHTKVNGITLRALLDSGSDQTLVHRKLVPPHIISNRDTMPICCIHGDEKPYPTADVYIKIDGQIYL